MILLACWQRCAAAQALERMLDEDGCIDKQSWVQHLLLMLLHGLPQPFVQSVVQRAGRLLGRSSFCWLASAVALVVWHVPAAFTLALHWETWHVVEHAPFLATGLLFWWPVVCPWPSASTLPR